MNTTVKPPWASTLEACGAVYQEDATPAHFGSARDELNAVFDSCALFDRSDLARIHGSGPDLLDLLHRLSTGAVRDLAPASGAATVLTTPKGRIVERLFVHHLGHEEFLLVGGAGCGERVAAHLDRYTFAEQIGLRDASSDTYQFALIGPTAAQTLRSLGAEPPAAYQSTALVLAGSAVQLLGQDGTAAQGYSVSGPVAGAARVWQSLAEAVRRNGGSPSGNEALESYRILRGLPAAGHELTEDYNPLEAGLREAVSFDKGCYVGQEVVARLQTYDKVSRCIVGLEMPAGAPVPPNKTALTLDGRIVGVLTSGVLPPDADQPIALGYVKRKELQPELVLLVGEAGPRARVVELPFPRG